MEFDYRESKNETAAKNQARKDLIELFKDFLSEKFGEDNVKIVGNNTLGFAFGVVKDRDGFECDLVATVTPCIKSYQAGGTKRKHEIYDLFEEAEAYENGWT